MNERSLISQRQELLTLREHMSLPPVFGEVRVAHILVFCVVQSRVLRSEFNVVISVTISL
jgi:hypothetical protein